MNNQEIFDLLRESGAVSATAGMSIHRAQGGLNRHAYFLNNMQGEPQLTIRVHNHADHLGNEARILQQLSECRGVPELVAVVPDKLLAHRYIPGMPRELELVSIAAIARLAELLACIHNLEQPGYTIWPSPNMLLGDRVDAYRARLGTMEDYVAFQHPPDSQTSSRVRRTYQTLKLLTPSGDGWRATTFSQLHGDLSIGNLIWNGDEIGLIDWEYARVGDPAEDFAYLLTEQPISRGRQRTLRNAYVAAGGEPDIWERLPYYLPLAALDAALWWVDHLLEKGDNPVSPEALTRLERAERFLATVDSANP